MVVKKGINDLQTVNPKLASEWHPTKNGDLKPCDIGKSSNVKAWWLCSKKHEWVATVGHRNAGHGCPYCSNKKVLKGFNDFATVCPSFLNEWDYDKNVFRPDEITSGTNKKIWWKCPNGHNSYQATIYHRRGGTGCPACSFMFATSLPEQILFYYLKKIYKDAISQYKDIFRNSMSLDIYIPSLKIGIEYDGIAWHSTEESKKREHRKYLTCKQNGILLYRIRERSNEIEDADVAISVPKFDSDNPFLFTEALKTVIQKITSLTDLDVDIERDIYEIIQYRVIKPEKSLAFLYPDISKEWHPNLNKSLAPSNVIPGTGMKVWWKCHKCGHEWKSSIAARVAKGSGCPICAQEQRKTTYHFTRLRTRDLLVGCKCLADWDYSKNKNLPEYYTKGSGDKVWWKCHKCGHEWKTQICNRTRDYKNGCPACSKRVVVKGNNDLLTASPELIDEWNYKLNGSLQPSDISQWSHKKVWWKCKKCGYSYEATPSNRALGKSCPCCAGRTVAKGINDLATTRPDLAIDWHPTKNGDLQPSDVTKGRRDMIWWKCHICGHEWKDTLNHRSLGRGCSNCHKLQKNENKKRH